MNGVAELSVGMVLARQEGLMVKVCCERIKKEKLHYYFWEI